MEQWSATESLHLSEFFAVFIVVYVPIGSAVILYNPIGRKNLKTGQEQPKNRFEPDTIPL